MRLFAVVVVVVVSADSSTVASHRSASLVATIGIGVVGDACGEPRQPARLGVERRLALATLQLLALLLVATHSLQRKVGARHHGARRLAVDGVRFVAPLAFRAPRQHLANRRVGVRIRASSPTAEGANESRIVVARVAVAVATGVSASRRADSPATTLVAAASPPVIHI
jgi:hypothetical protein